MPDISKRSDDKVTFVTEPKTSSKFLKRADSGFFNLNTSENIELENDEDLNEKSSINP